MEDLRTIVEVRKALLNFLEEDIGTGDITSNSMMPENLTAYAEIICKTDNVIAGGLEEASIIFELCGCSSTVLAEDGTKLKKGNRVMSISGNPRSILKAERVALNLLMRMSGIATETRMLVDLAHPVKVAATRKTAPGLRYFDKKAVVIGGGLAHRMRLDDMILIKDNHIAILGSPRNCIDLARKKMGSSVKIECEVQSIEEMRDAIDSGADIIMLDNFTPAQATKAIGKIVKLGLRKKVLIEISGGMNYKNIRQYARAKPDYISAGYITHSPKAADFSLEILKR